MTVLKRQTQKIFAGSANGDQLAVMGTMKTGTPVYSNNLATLQSSSYTQGWSSAILEDKAPYLEEMNGIQYGLSYQIAYLLQEGIPEYDVNTNYSNKSIVKVIENNNLVLYHSLINDNQGVTDITNSNNWSRLYIVDFGRIGEPQITLNNTLPDGCIWLEGQAVSRTTYSALFSIYGTTYGTGNNSTTFNLPDFRNRAIWGGTNFGYITAGLPNITASTNSAGAHTHTRGTMNITGQIKLCNGWGGDTKTTGAFTKTPNGSAPNGGASNGVIVKFNASSSWTGATSSNGAHTHTVTVSSSTAGILGNSTTVQPPAIKVRVYTRYQ